jgi:L-asparaginase II
VAVSVETIIGSAVAAGTVALLVEYAAKPRLEARKERILAAHRDRQRLHDRLIAIGMAAARLKHDRLPNDIDTEVRQALRGEDQRALATVDVQTRELVDDLGHAAGTYAWRIKDLVVGYAALVRGWSLSDRTAAEKGRLIAEITTPMIGYLAGSGWRPFRRARYMREVCALVEQHTGTNLIFGNRRSARAVGAAQATD